MQRLSERASRDAGGEQLGLDGVAERAPADELLAPSNWAGRTETGDRAELDVEPSAVAWSAVSVSARQFRGAARCPSGDVCFAAGARLNAQRADVPRVNPPLTGLHSAAGGLTRTAHRLTT